MKKEEIIKLYNSYKHYVFPFIVALSSVFLIIFAIYPQTIKVISNQKKAGDLMAKSKFLADKVSALESFDEEDLAAKLELALSVYPSEKDFANIFGLLRQLVSGSGFSLTSISLENSAFKSADSESFGVKIDAKGSKALLGNLFNNLQNSPRLLKIESFDISSKAAGGIEVSLSLQVLYASTPSSAGTSDSPLSALSQKDEETLASLSKITTILPKSAQTFSASARGKSNPFD